MRKYVVPLFIANGVAFAAVGCSYVFYSRLLTAAEFGIYSAALAVGNLATLVLDGGIRTSLIKHAEVITKKEESALLGMMLAFSFVLILGILGGHGLVEKFYPAAADEIGFIAMFAAVYLLTYPWIGLPTARLERDLAYGRLAWIESAGIILERGAPVIFLYCTGQGIYSFVTGLALGRVFRVAALAMFHSVKLEIFSFDSIRSVFHLVREGAWYQAGSAASLIRDNLHVLIVGPMFGAAWVGYYAWGLQLCLIASQIFVQISARISVPIAAQAPDFQARWTTITRQIALLTATTGPILAVALLVVPAVDHEFLNDKWRPALVLLPFLFARMLPGVACTPAGTLLLVEKGARSFAAAVWAWTIFEVAAALLAVYLLGSIGLAVSCSVAAWFGVAAFVRGLDKNTKQLFLRVVSLILVRPSVWVSLGIVLPYLFFPIAGRDLLGRVYFPLLLLGLAVITCMIYLIDADLRRVFFGGRRSGA